MRAYSVQLWKALAERSGNLIGIRPLLQWPIVSYDCGVSSLLEKFMFKVSQYACTIHTLACRESTTSMTSVPKPLKFLRSHYKEMKDLYESIPAQNRNKPALADIISVMAITSGKLGERESLHFRYTSLICRLFLVLVLQFYDGHIMLLTMLQVVRLR
jgi:hypothetical protein